jgi:hypothetical protein
LLTCIQENPNVELQEDEWGNKVLNECFLTNLARLDAKTLDIDLDHWPRPDTPYLSYTRAYIIYKSIYIKAEQT